MAGRAQDAARAAYCARVTLPARLQGKTSLQSFLEARILGWSSNFLLECADILRHRGQSQTVGVYQILQSKPLSPALCKAV